MRIIFDTLRITVMDAPAFIESELQIMDGFRRFDPWTVELPIEHLDDVLITIARLTHIPIHEVMNHWTVELRIYRRAVDGKTVVSSLGRTIFQANGDEVQFGDDVELVAGGVQCRNGILKAENLVVIPAVAECHIDSINGFSDGIFLSHAYRII